MDVQVVPVAVPRRISSGFLSVAGAHSFGLLFGTIWAGIGGLLTLIFGVVAIGFPPMLLGVVIASFFLLSGLAILAVTLQSAAVRHWVYAHGHVVRGRVSDKVLDARYRKNGRPATRITFSYEDERGVFHSGDETTFDVSGAGRMRSGREVDLIVDPYNPAAIFCPTLHGIRFAASPPARRLTGAALAIPTAAEPPAGSWRCKLGPTFERPPRPWWIFGATTPEGALGELVANEDALAWSMDDEQRQVSWAEPFSVNASVWPLGEEVELNITVRSPSMASNERGIRFKTRVPPASSRPACPCSRPCSPLYPRSVSPSCTTTCATTPLCTASP